MEFERVRYSRTDYVEMSDYDQTLLQAFVTAAVERKDNSRLVYLLSGKSPRYVGAVPIELYLGINSTLGFTNRVRVLTRNQAFTYSIDASRSK